MFDQAWLAYIDPGSGFIVIQIVAAGVIGGTLYFRKAVRKVVSFIPGLRKPEEPIATDHSPHQEPPASRPADGN